MLLLVSSFLLLVASSVIDAASVKASRCEISIRYRKGDLREPQPLLLTADGEPRFLMPSAPQLVSTPLGSKILLSCPGRGNSFRNLTSSQTVKLECAGGKDFLLDEKRLPFDAFSCKRIPEDTVRRTNASCSGGHQAYEIGFRVMEAFVPTIELCRDEASFVTHHVKETIPKEIGNYQFGFPRRAWRYNGYFGGYEMNRLYSRARQLETLQLLLGEEAAGRHVTPRRFLTKGHLAANADFVYGAQQATSLWYLNCQPQWNFLNSGNWQLLEGSVRRLAARRRTDLLVYTGVHGVLSLTDENNNPVDVYLYANDTTRGVPVPKFFWKVVQDPASKRAAAFVSLNDAHAEEVTDDVYLCPDVGEDKRFSWLTWKPKNVTLGFSYACRVDDLRKAVPTVPEIGETGLLTD